MDLEQLARETAEKIIELVGKNAVSEVSVIAQLQGGLSAERQIESIISTALQSATQETRQLSAQTHQDLLELLVSTDETVALHSKFTAKYRGI